MEQLRDTSTLQPPQQVTQKVQEAGNMLRQAAAVPAGALETGLAALTGAIAAPIGAVGGIYKTLTGGKFGTPEGIQQGQQRAAEIQAALTYQPSTAAGQQLTEQFGRALEATKLPPVAVPEVMGMAPLARAAQQQAADAIARARQVPAPGVQTMQPPPNLAAQAQVPPAVRAQVQAAQTAQPQVMTPQAVQQMQQQFATRQAAAPVAVPAPVAPPAAKPLVGMGAAAVEPETLRVERARQLPIPIELSKDQATRDPADVRFARETAKDPVFGAPLQQKYATDNAKIQRNLDHMVEQTGAEFSGLAPGELGQRLVNTLNPYMEQRKGAIGPAYEAARTAGEMNEPVSIQKLNEFVEKNRSAAKNAPVISTVESEIKRLAKDGEMTINDLEEVRKLVGVLAQEHGPNSYFGKQAIRLIDNVTEGKGGDLYKQARKLNAEYMREFENTPVVKNIFAMKPGTTQRAVAIENLVDKSMLRGPTADVKQLFNTLNKAGPEGQQMINELRGYVAQRIKDEATKGVGRDINGLPYVSTQGLNKIIADLDKSGKLELIFGKNGAETYRTLNDVTKDLQTVPVGTTNPSGTASTILAALGEMGAQTALTGVPLPAMMIGKQIYGSVQNKRKASRIQDFINYGKEK
jgi:hypothetical protein